MEEQRDGVGPGETQGPSEHDAFSDFLSSRLETATYCQSSQGFGRWHWAGLFGQAPSQGRVREGGREVATGIGGWPGTVRVAVISRPWFFAIPREGTRPAAPQQEDGWTKHSVRRFLSASRHDLDASLRSAPQYFLLHAPR